MDHQFIPSKLNNSLCSVCHHIEIYHTDKAVCESCEAVGKVNLYHNMFLCDKCLNAELNTESSVKVPQVPQVPQIPSLKTDIFNSTMESIAELKLAIDADPSISDKTTHLAEALIERFRQLQDAIFKIDEEKLELLNKQRAIQVYLNDLAAKLRVEERERLKLQNINYKPPIKVKATPKTKARPKIDKAEVKRLAAELGVAEYTLRSVMIARNCDAQSAANLLRRTIAESKSEDN